MGDVQTLRRRGAAARRAAAGAEALLDRWVARLDVAAPVAPGPKRDALDPAAAQRVEAALARVAVRGASVAVDDAAGGTVVLARGPSQITHPGTVAVRGPYGLTLDMLRKHVAATARFRALEFVASWYGAPFDAVAIDRRDPTATLRWGFWPLGAEDTCRALGAWKERAPASFAALLGDYGVDVAPPERVEPVERERTPGREPEEGAARAPTLIVLDPEEGTSRGAAAFARVGRDPRRLALLARAGRHDDAKRAQVDVVMERTVLPLLRMSIRRGDERRALGDLALGARALAGLLVALRATGFTELTALLAVAAEDGPPRAEKTWDEGAWLESVAATLRSAERGDVAEDILRSLSSPELQI